MRVKNMARIAALFTSCFGKSNGQMVDPPLISGKANAPEGVPDYVVKYAPLVYLHSDDIYGPSDIGAQLTNTTPKVNFNALPDLKPDPYNLDTMDRMNEAGTNGTNVYLTSNDDISKTPNWLKGVTPNVDGLTKDATTCTVIVVEKGNGTVDAFYMYFYAFNWGGIVLGKNLGNHVGDWEHTMVRFVNGEPKSVWLSQHSGGQAFAYKTLQKDKTGLRPLVFSANGSHANYAVTGLHNHDNADFHLPVPGFVNDYTEAGPLWDPVQSAYWYKWTQPASVPAGTQPPKPEVLSRDTTKLGIFTPYDPETPVGFLYYVGRWGDLRYKVDDPRQDEIFTLAWKYDTGPTGPAYKKLDRKEVWSTAKGKLLTKLVP
ncbi:hypothetical protein EJ06DRAFT_533129 [Trichodelitschia bisporula]|uniref:Vacuolar protein sorting-associated protein 62 n=1 Tax=Trichodelitschia bisporula TaxID=703511 RepID=A0A6G1HNW2_9PEZI|nr:hypothetical protein EJ06DRAFT_533129 [Trichodelitschia bisporula]